mgnify:CR=1 FL=1
MKVSAVIFLMVSVLAVSVYAVDPGVPDTVIYQSGIYVPYNPGNWSRVVVEVYFVTDDSVSDFTLPTLWRSADDLIYLDSILWREAFSGWDDTWYRISQDSNFASIIGWSDLGGPDNPPLYTGLQRVVGMELIFKIRPTAARQIVTIDTTRDQRTGSANFGMPDGANSFTPRIVAGSFNYGVGTGIDDISGLPNDYILKQNFPNPFNPTTNIEFSIPQSGHVSLEVFNLLGQKINTIFSGVLGAGAHTFSWNGTDDSGKPVPSGAYFYRLSAGDFVQAKEMMLLK